MKKYFIIYVLILGLLVVSCGTMRSPNSASKSSKTKTKIKPNKDKNESLTDDLSDSLNVFERFTDTVTVVLPPVVSNAIRTEINTELDEAVNEFENGNYTSACEKIFVYSGIFTIGDSLYYEAKYYEAECFVMNANAKEAISLYRELLEDDNLTLSVRERVIIRLGQLYCFINDKTSAEFMFARLKKEFPNSIYTEIANCNSIKK